MSEPARNEFGQPVGWPVDVQPAGFPSIEPMVGQHCTIVAVDADAHAAALFAAYDQAPDDSDWTYLPYGPFATVAGLADLLRSFDKHDDRVAFTILDGDGSPVGISAYLRVNSRDASIEVGSVFFSPALQRTPAATEAMFLMMQRAFTTGYRRYEWKCDELNAPSQAAARRLGFTSEGVWRQATHYKGRNRDTAWFSITDRDWPALKAEFERWLGPSNFDESGNQLSPLNNRQVNQ